MKRIVRAAAWLILSVLVCLSAVTCTPPTETPPPDETDTTDDTDEDDDADDAGTDDTVDGNDAGSADGTDNTDGTDGSDESGDTPDDQESSDGSAERNILFKTNRDLMEGSFYHYEEDYWETKSAYVKELYMMEPDGSLPVRLTTATTEDWDYTFCDFTGTAEWSPDGTRILYAYRSPNDPEAVSIYVMNADRSAVSRVFEISHDANIPSLRWSPDGTHIGFTAEGFGTADSAPHEFHGIMTICPDGTGFAYVPYSDEYLWEPRQASWAPGGERFVYSDGETLRIIRIHDGETVEIPVQTTGNADPDWHPNLEKIMYEARIGSQWDIFSVNADGSDVRNLTDSPWDDLDPDWSVDGARIAFSSNREGNFDVYVMNADGTGVTNLTLDPADDTEPAW